LIKEFKEFLLRGNVLDLAVGVVIGSAFTAIVTNVVNGVITPLIGWFVSLVTNGQKLDDATSILDWTPAKGVTFAFGDLASAIITFIITGFVLFIIVKVANKAKSSVTKPVEEEKAAPTAEDYLRDIRDLLEKDR